uniref:uncharacterized protein LOC124023130 isoform X6 n=1 Tax=Oncorhynchus gorbuscha TaxID=8017 RepID=UPI001EAEC049|nr:uncharacterized protein LOC124023130 isoform X6 [Oncorhynchus gorbuscha]
MASVKLEDCSQTLELNVNIKDEEVEEKIGKPVSHGRLELHLGTSVKLEDCSQTLELNVDIKDEEAEEKIGEPVSHGDHVETFSTSREQQQEDHRAKRSHHCPHSGLCPKTCPGMVPRTLQRIQLTVRGDGTSYSE